MKPAFWSDSKVAELSERTRLFYIGLWMIADDAGWLRWDASEVARDLYGYESRTKRERRAEAMFAELVTAGRVVIQTCGHATIPTMPGHQRLAGSTKQVTSFFNEHQRSCMTPRVSPQVPASPRHGKERLGTVVEQETERNGTVRNGSAPAGADVLAQRDEEDRLEQAARRSLRPVS